MTTLLLKRKCVGKTYFPKAVALMTFVVVAVVVVGAAGGVDGLWCKVCYKLSQ